MNTRRPWWVICAAFTVCGAISDCSPSANGDASTLQAQEDPISSGGTCAGPIVIPAAGGTFSGSTDGASALSSSCGSTGLSPENVYSWTPALSGVATIQTCSATLTTYDTVLYLRAGSCSGPELACNDDTVGCGTTTDLSSPHRGSRVTTAVAAGQTYFIVVDGYGGSKGNYSLTVTPPGPPTGACANPTVVPPQGGTFTGTTSGASTQSASCGSTGLSPETVYSWTPSASGVATIQTCSTTSTTYDTVLYLRGGSCTGNELACNDDTAGCGISTDGSNPHRGSRLTPTVTAGQTYFVFVDGYGGSSGAYSLSILPPAEGPPPPPPPQAGTCAQPIPIPAAGGVFSGTTSGSSALSSSCGSTGSSPELVYTWTPTASGLATIQTCSATSTTYDTVLYLRAGSCAGSELACNDDTTGCGITTDLSNPHRGSRLTPTVTAGQTYVIVVDGYGGNRGSFSLAVTPPSSCAAPYSSCSGACVNLQTDANHCGACGNVCPTGRVCQNGSCSGGACTPTTCAAQGKNCGSIPDGCGATLACGSCTSPQTCGGGGVPNVCGAATADFARLRVLSTKRIYFQHASVGGEAMGVYQGPGAWPDPRWGMIKIVADNPGSGTTVATNANTAGAIPVGSIGEWSHGAYNGQPATKLSLFNQYVRGGLGGAMNFALFKLGTPDIDQGNGTIAGTSGVSQTTWFTTVYQPTMLALQNAYPTTTFLHVTVPIHPRAAYWGNVYYEQWNNILRSNYPGRVFDLAYWESVDAEGERDFGPDGAPCINDEWAVGGDAHVDEAGANWLGEHLLAFLAGLP